MKNRKVLIITFIIIAVLVLGVIGCKVLFINLNKNGSNKERYTLKVYKYGNEYCNEKSDYCNEIGFIIKTETNNAKILSFNDDFLLYNDNGLKLYNINTKEKIMTNLKDKYDHNNYTIVSNKGNALGIIYKDINSDFCGYYNLLKKEKMYENKYKSIKYFNILDDTYLEINNSTANKHIIQLLNIENEKIEATFDGDDFKVETYNDKYLLIGGDFGLGGGITSIYGMHKEQIFKGFLKTDIEYELYNGNVYIYDSNDQAIKKIDFDGDILTNKVIEKEKFNKIIRNYSFYLEDNYLKMYNMDTKEEIKVTEWKDNYCYIYEELNGAYSLPGSNYYTYDPQIGDTFLDDFERFSSNPPKDDGIYIVIGLKEKDKNGNYGLIYYFDESNKTFKTYNIDKLKYKSVMLPDGTIVRR